MDRSRRFFGVVLIVLSILALISWERWGRTRFIYDDVLVFRRNVTKGTIITRDMLTTAQMENAGRDMLRPEDGKRIVGKEAAQFIHRQTPVFRQYFMENELLTGTKLNRYALRIPESWAESIPFSMHRGDRAVFCADGVCVMEVPVSRVDQKAENFEVIVSKEQLRQLSRMNRNGKRFVISYSR